MKRSMNFRNLMHVSHGPSFHSKSDKKFWLSFLGNSMSVVEYRQVDAFAAWLRETADWMESVKRRASHKEKPDVRSTPDSRHLRRPARPSGRNAGTTKHRSARIT